VRRALWSFGHVPAWQSGFIKAGVGGHVAGLPEWTFTPE
jgi:hypothetical protein